MKKMTLIIALILLFPILSMAQKVQDYEQEPNWYIIPEGLNMSLNNFIDFYKKSFNMSDKNKFVVEEIKTDLDTIQNIQFCRLKHYYNDIEVENSQLLVNIKDGFVEFANGWTINDIDNAINFSLPQVKEDVALDIIMKDFNNEKFAWLDTTLENHLKQIVEDSNATFYPKSSLKIKLINGITKLSKDFPITVSDTIFGYKCLITSIDAFNGNVMLVDEELNEGWDYCRNGKVETLYYGRQTDMETMTSWNRPYWCLKNCWDISTSLGYRSSFLNLFSTCLIDSDNEWTSISERPATTAHWALNKIFYYFKDKFGVSSLGDNHIQVYAGIDYYNNACFRVGQYFYFGIGNSFNIIELGKNSDNNLYYSAVDIIAHEYSHGIIRYNSKLGSKNEPGALNESFADIFATLAERAILQRYNWTIGEDVGTFRDMSNPEVDYYHGENWWTSSDDDGGVHSNNGVQNKWFYLLATQIGDEKAGKIAWWTQLFLNPTSTYNDSKNRSIMLAKLIYGDCSEEHKATIDAWYEVGVSNMPSECYCRKPYHILPLPFDCFGFGEKNKNKNNINVNIYPNPASNILNIEMPNYMNCSYKIINILGNNVIEGYINNNLTQINVSNLSNGTYIIEINSLSDMVTRDKFIINK